MMKLVLQTHYESKIQSATQYRILNNSNFIFTIFTVARITKISINTVT